MAVRAFLFIPRVQTKPSMKGKAAAAAATFDYPAGTEVDSFQTPLDRYLPYTSLPGWQVWPGRGTGLTHTPQINRSLNTSIRSTAVEGKHPVGHSPPAQRWQEQSWRELKLIYKTMPETSSCIF